VGQSVMGVSPSPEKEKGPRTVLPVSKKCTRVDAIAPVLGGGGTTLWVGGGLSNNPKNKMKNKYGPAWCYSTSKKG